MKDNHILGKYLADEINQRAMTNEGDSASEQIEARVDWLVRQLDELCAMVSNPETQDLIAGQTIGIGQIAFRAQLILSFLDAHKTPKLKVISNGR